GVACRGGRAVRRSGGGRYLRPAVPVPGINPIEAIAMERNFPSTPPAGVRFSKANGALRRAAVVARPFDEDIPAAEDHLWACGIGRDERIVYVPEAAVGHSHPMTFREWRFRFYINGLAAEAPAWHRAAVGRRHARPRALRPRRGVPAARGNARPCGRAAGARAPAE